MAALDYFTDPSSAGILGLASGLLQSGGPQPFPHSFGQGLAAGFGSMQQAQHAALLNKLSAEQIRALQIANMLSQGKAEFFAGGPGQPGSVPLPSGSPQASVPTPPGISPSSLQGAFPALSGQEAGALSAANTQTAPPAQPQSAPGGFPNVPGLTPELSRAAALGWLAPEYVSAVARAPIALRPGGSLVSQTGQNIYTAPNIPAGMQMTGGAAQNIPGFISSQGEQERLKAGTTAGYQVHPMPYASGATVPTFGANIPGFPGTPGMQPPQMVPAPVQAPRPFASPGAQPADPWSTMPKLETPTGLGQTTYQKGRAEGAASLAGELSKKTADAAGIANERLVYNTQAMDLVNTATTGKGALSIANVKNFLNSRMGIPLETLDKVSAGDANATTALNKDLINAATQKAKQAYGSRITQSEVMLQIKQASPNVDQLTGTIKYLLQTDSAMSQYQIQKAQDLGRYLKQGGDPYEFEGWHSKTFPMSAAVAGIHLNSGSASNIDALLKKYGKP